jgi:RNA polymerase sigma factor (TIGR02999 family)
MDDITRLLARWGEGDARALEDLTPIVYQELRQLAHLFMRRESHDHTLQPTALVHEAYLRLVGSPDGEHWNHRGHFFAAAAESIRRILVENARRKQRLKHGGDRRRVDLEVAESLVQAPSEDLAALDEALTRLYASGDDWSRKTILNVAGSGPITR